MMLSLDRTNHCLVCKMPMDIYSRHKNLNDMVQGAGGRTVRSCLEQVLDVSLADAATIWLCNKCYSDLERIQLYYNLVKHYRERFHNTVQLVAPPSGKGGGSAHGGYSSHPPKQYAQTQYDSSNLLFHSSPHSSDILVTLASNNLLSSAVAERTATYFCVKYDPHEKLAQHQSQQLLQVHGESCKKLHQSHQESQQQPLHHMQKLPPQLLEQQLQESSQQPHHYPLEQPPQQTSQQSPHKQPHQHRHPQQGPHGESQQDQSQQRENLSQHPHQQQSQREQPVAEQITQSKDSLDEQEKLPEKRPQEEEQTRGKEKRAVDSDFFDRILHLQAIPEAQIKKEVEKIVPNAGSSSDFIDDNRCDDVITSLGDVTGMLEADSVTTVVPNKVKGSVKVMERELIDEAAFECYICHLIFKTETRLKRHMVAHRHNGPFKCSICTKGFTNKKQLRLHTLCHVRESSGVEETTNIGSHSVTVTDGCDSAPLPVPKEENLEEEDEIVVKPKTYTCRICIKSFTQPRLLQLHRRTMHRMVRYSDGDKSLQCPDCKECFDNVDLVCEHLRDHICSWLWKCHLCEEGFIGESALKRHLRIHVSESQLTCVVCGKQLSVPGYMKEHLRTHSGEMPHECAHCKKRFNNPSNLKRHKRIHTGEKPYKCTVCGIPFRQIGPKKVHELTHTGKPPHVCPTCGKEFFWPSSYKKHLQIHTDDKPELCSTCGKSFRNIPDLNAHARSHSDYRPHVCNYCGKGFKTSKHLSVHKRIHTGEKPFICKLCGRGFSQRTGLKCHLKSHNISSI